MKVSHRVQTKRAAGAAVKRTFITKNGSMQQVYGTIGTANTLMLSQAVGVNERQTDTRHTQW